MSKVTPETMNKLLGSLSKLFADITEEQAENLLLTVESGIGVNAPIPGMPQLEERSERDELARVVIAEGAARSLRIGVAYNGAIISMLRSGLDIPKEETELLSDTNEMLEKKLMEIGVRNISKMMETILAKANELTTLDPEKVEQLEEMKAHAKDLSKKIKENDIIH